MNCSSYHLLLSTLLLLFFNIGNGQDFIMGDVLNELPNSITFCKPGVIGKSKSKGVMLLYGLHSGYPQMIEGTNIDENLSNVEILEAKIKIPLVNAPDVKVLFGYEFGFRKYHFNESDDNFYTDIFNRIDDRTLKENIFSVYLTKAFDERNYGALRIRANYTGDYEGWLDLEDHHAIYNVTAVWGIKPRAELEWGIGLSYSKRFFRDNDQVLPFLVYNHTFNSEWGIESTLPAQIFLRHNFSGDQIVLFGLSAQSYVYSIDVLSNVDREPTHAFRELGVNTGLTYEQKLFSWIWMKIDGGYHIPIRSEFIAVDNDFEDFIQKPNGRPFFNLGLFLTPPDDFIR